VNKFIPVFFHNFSKYDCHLFIQELGKIPGGISVIPKINTVKFFFSNDIEFRLMRKKGIFLYEY